jgi:hypothetical protein
MKRLDCRLFEAGIFIDTLKGAAHVKLEVHTKSELGTHRALGWRGKGARKRQMNTTQGTYDKNTLSLMLGAQRRVILLPKSAI